MHVIFLRVLGENQASDSDGGIIATSAGVRLTISDSLQLSEPERCSTASRRIATQTAAPSQCGDGG